MFVLKLEMVVDAITALSAANVGRLVLTLPAFPVRPYNELKTAYAFVLHKKKYRGWKPRGWRKISCAARMIRTHVACKVTLLCVRVRVCVCVGVRASLFNL